MLTPCFAVVLALDALLLLRLLTLVNQACDLLVRMGKVLLKKEGSSRAEPSKLPQLASTAAPAAPAAHSPAVAGQKPATTPEPADGGAYDHAGVAEVFSGKYKCTGIEGDPEGTLRAAKMPSMKVRVMRIGKFGVGAQFMNYHFEGALFNNTVRLSARMKTITLEARITMDGKWCTMTNPNGTTTQFKCRKATRDIIIMDTKTPEGADTTTEIRKDGDGVRVRQIVVDAKGQSFEFTRLCVPD